MKLPILFMGSPQVAVTILKGLVESGHTICAVVTQPDKPAGRGQSLTPPPVKIYAESQNLKIIQPEKVKTPEFLEQLKSFQPQVIVVAAYGRILSQEIIDLAPWKCLNVHFSLLPKYRGASCVASAIRNRDAETGITIMQMVEKLDAGPILKQKKTPIGLDETTGILEDRLAQMAPALLNEVFQEFEQNKTSPQEQDESATTYAPLIKKEEGKIDWSLPAEKIDCLIRAMNPWPVAFTSVDNQRLKIYGARPLASPLLTKEGAGGGQSPESGKILAISDAGIEVACGEKSLLLTEVQPESKKRMKASEFARGQKNLIQVGKILK